LRHIRSRTTSSTICRDVAREGERGGADGMWIPEKVSGGNTQNGKKKKKCKKISSVREGELHIG